MQKIRSEIWIRSAIALVILLAGVAMAPFVDLPKIRLGWQRFAGVYEAQLVVNYDEGQPGSIFHFTGTNYPPNELAIILIDGEEVGEVMTDANGQLGFNIGTNQAQPGAYTVTAMVDSNSSASDSFTLTSNAPLRVLEGDGPIFAVVPVLYLPLLYR
jgi:hypothetical protein